MTPRPVYEPDPFDTPEDVLDAIRAERDWLDAENARMREQSDLAQSLELQQARGTGAMRAEIERLRNALADIAAADPGPGASHINGVFVGRIARDALSLPDGPHSVCNLCGSRHAFHGLAACR